MKRYPITILVTAFTILAAIFPALTNAWQLNFDAVQDGQWWCLWTGHVTHYDGSHLFWDLLMFVALSTAIERKHARGFAVAMFSMMPLVGLTVWFTCPDITIYRGLSGLDTGLFVWFVADQIRDAYGQTKSSHEFLHPPFGRVGPLRAGEGSRWIHAQPSPRFARPSQREGEARMGGDSLPVKTPQPERRLAMMLWSATLVGLVGKLIYEASTGDTLFVDSSSFRPLVESHLAGAVCGGVYAAWGMSRPCSWYTYRKTSATA